MQLRMLVIGRRIQRGVITRQVNSEGTGNNDIYRGMAVFDITYGRVSGRGKRSSGRSRSCRMFGVSCNAPDSRSWNMGNIMCANLSATLPVN